MNNNVNQYFVESLQEIYKLAPSVSLCIYPPTAKLFVVKEIETASAECFEKLCGICCDSIARVRCVFYRNGKAFSVRDYVEGEPLSKLLERTTLTSQKAAEIACDVCRGLSRLHKIGLVHRDINPNNIIITPEGHAKIIDFGIIRTFLKQKEGDTVIMGTPGFAAPEQFGFHQSDEKTDIYAVGVLICVMLTGQLPSAGLPKGRMGGIVKKCVEMDPKKRFESTEEIIRILSKDKGKIDIQDTAADRFVSAIPGLRSGKKSVVVLAVLGYILAALMTIGIFASLKSLKQLPLTVLAWVMTFAVPFFCFHNFLGVWDKLPFSAGADRRSQRRLYGLLGGLSIFFGIMFFGIANS